MWLLNIGVMQSGSLLHQPCQVIFAPGIHFLQTQAIAHSLQQVLRLPTFLKTRATGPLGTALGFHKALTWVAKHAGLSALTQCLQSSLCKSYVSGTRICEKRESAPLPLFFLVFLECAIIRDSYPPSTLLQIGSILLLVWSSLRWSDGLWVSPGSLQLQDDVLYGSASHTKTTNRGMPFACYTAGFTGHGSTVHWCVKWMNLVMQAVHDTMQLHPTFKIDFLLTETGEDQQRPLFVQPMSRARGIHLLRYLLRLQGESLGFQVEPEYLHLLGTHSCKTTLLCWGQQLNLSLESRRLQGHHRMAEGMASVALYSRSDVFPAVQLQRQIAKKIADGFRPVRPMLRGGSPPLFDKPVIIPPWPAFGRVASQVLEDATVPREPPPQVADVDEEVFESGSDDSASEQEVAEPPLAPDFGEIDEFVFLVNTISNVAHIGLTCDLSDGRAILSENDVWYRAVCGARPSLVNGDLSLATALEPGHRLCLRRACVAAVAS